MADIRRESAFLIWISSAVIAVSLLLCGCGKGEKGSEEPGSITRVSIAAEDSLAFLVNTHRYDLAWEMLGLQPKDVTARWLYWRGYFLREMATFFGDLYDFSLVLNRHLQELRAGQGIDSPLLPFVQGMLTFEAKAYREADRYFRQMQRIDKTLQTRADILHGAALFALEDREGAEELWERSREKWRKDPVAQALAWDVLWAVGTELKGVDIEESEILEQLRGLEPGWENWARAHVAAGALVRGEVEASLDILRAYDPIVPLFEEAFRGTYSGNEYERAFFSTLFLKVYSDAYYILAERDFTTALDKGLEPNDALFARYYRGLIYREQGRYQEAYHDLMKVYKDTVDLKENLYLTYVRNLAGIRAGECLYRMDSDRGEEAQVLWREVLRSEGMDVPPDVETVRQAGIATGYFEVQHRLKGIDISKAVKELFQFLHSMDYLDLTDEEMLYYYEACVTLSRLYVEESGSKDDQERAIQLLNAGAYDMSTNYSPRINNPVVLLLLSRAYYAHGLNRGLGNVILGSLYEAYPEVFPVLQLYKGIQASLMPAGKTIKG